MQHNCPDAPGLARLLQSVQQDPHAALILSSFPGIAVGEEFDLLSERELQEATGLLDVRGQVFRASTGRAMVGRFIERVAPSDWLLFDRDTDGQTPAHFGPDQLPYEPWLMLLDCVLPGVSAAPRVTLPSSSARIVRSDGSRVGHGNGHTFILATGDQSQLKVQAEAAAIRAGVVWPWVNKGGARSTRTLCDLSVWTPGRLVFDGCPTADAPLRVAPPEVSVHNEFGQPVRLAAIPMPSAEEFRALTLSAGAEKVLRNDGRGGLDSYDLPMSATIDTEDHGPLTVPQCVAELTERGGKLRCQTPFRESASFAGVLRLGGDGKPMLYDVGTGTTHWLRHEDHAAQHFAAAPAILPPAATPLTLPPPPPATPINRFAAAARPLSAQQHIERPPAIVHNLISERSISMLWGPPGAAKSFVLADLARAISTGQQWCGRNTASQRVLYVSTEGNVRVRFEADGLDLPDLLTLELQINLADPHDCMALADLVRAERLGVIVYDVLSECFLGDENSTEDMQHVSRGIRWIRDQTGVAQIFAHHSNKQGDAVRGSSVVKGFVDNELRIVREPGAERRTLRVEKCRDGRDYYDLTHFDLESVDLGPDTDPIAPEGARRTTARLVWVSAQESAIASIKENVRPPLAHGRNGKPSHEARAYAELRAAGADGLDSETWLTRFTVGGNFADAAAAKKEYRAVHKSLADKGYTRSEIGPGGVTVFKLAHDLEVAERDAFARFATAGAADER